MRIYDEGWMRKGSPCFSVAANVYHAYQKQEKRQRNYQIQQNVKRIFFGHQSLWRNKKRALWKTVDK